MKTQYTLLLLFLLTLYGCGGEEKFRATTTLQQFQESHTENKDQKSDNATISIMPLTLEDGEGGGDYLLGSGDVLNITVFETEDLNAVVRVSSRGVINVPLLGDVSVVNLTAAEVEKKIADLYRKDYIHNPHVSVYIKEHLSKQITLVGAVGKPGTFDYVTRRRLLDVLAIGGGLEEDAGSFAFITRLHHKTGKSSNYMVDLDDLVRNGNMALNHIILGGDVIFIPESGQCFVDGAVRKPGTYSLTNNMTITEAIVLAGGLAGYADDDSIKLIRFVGRGKPRQVVSLSYNDLQAGLGDKLILRDQDVVYAESSASGKFMSGTGFRVGFMGTGISFRDPTQ